MKYDIDVDKMIYTKNKIQEKMNEVDELCRECYQRIEKSKEVFDTPTATLFRDKANELVFQGQKYIDNTVKPYIECLNDITNRYQDMINKVKMVVDKGAF